MRRHRVPVEEPAHVFVDHRMPREQALPPAELFVRGQMAVDEQVGRLREGAPLAQLLDGNAAIAEDALLAVEKGDRALRGGGVHEGGIESDQTGFRAQVGDFDSLLALRPLDHLQLHLLLACDDADGLGHGLAPSRSSAVDELYTLKPVVAKPPYGGRD